MLRVFFGLGLVAACSFSSAAESRHSGAVNEILVDNDRYGLCMVAVAGYSAPAGCKEKWISFDCQGAFHDKSISRAMFESAQMAYALEKSFSVMVADNKKHDGWCIATRTFNLQ